MLPPQKLAALGGRLVRLVVKPALDHHSRGWGVTISSM